MKRIIDLTCIIILFSFVGIGIIMLHQQQLDDYRFEINHLQTKLYRLQELSDYVPAMEQLLPPEVLAQLKAATLMIQRKRWKEYERYEQPLIEGEINNDPIIRKSRA